MENVNKIQKKIQYFLRLLLFDWRSFEQNFFFTKYIIMHSSDPIINVDEHHAICVCMQYEWVVCVCVYVCLCGKSIYCILNLNMCRSLSLKYKYKSKFV